MTPRSAGADLARFYDLDVAEERADIPLYLSLASATDGAILELACGSGRICVPLAAAGHRVTGVDKDPEMLNRARRAWDASRSSGHPTRHGDLSLVEADVTTLRLPSRFDLVILGFNSLLLLDAAGQRAALRVIRRHLSAYGRAVVDVWLPDADDLAVYDGNWIHDWTRSDPETDQTVTKRTRAVLDAESGRATVETAFTIAPADQGYDTRLARTDQIQFVTGGQLLQMLDGAGLHPQLVAQDHDMTEFEPTADRMIVVAAPVR